MQTWKGVDWVLDCICDGADYYPALAGQLLELLPEAFFWPDLAHVSSASGKLVELTPAAFKKTVTATGRAWELTSSTANPPLKFRCHRLANQISFKLEVHDDYWRESGAGLASSLEQLSLAFVAALRTQAIFASKSGVYPSFNPDLEYPHRDEPPPLPIFRYDLVMNVLDRRMVQRLAAVNQAEASAMMKRVCAAAPPRGVRRVVEGEQTLLFWTDDLHDEQALGRAAAAHERWLDKALEGK
ncbi:MAG TPA: hypothetical protein VK607_10205 [Kofleriaceae bacterium]|nr:hypothetical protein [Kofleriaceae bacterium]